MTRAADWSGRVGEVWAEEWRRTERAFAWLEPLLEAAVLSVAPERGRFLDIGCGVGTTSLCIARSRPGAEVTGVDLAGGMVALARERGRSYPNVGFVQADALAHADTHGRFDLFFSRHGVMFFADPVDAFRRVRAAAAPGASLVFSCFAAPEDNRWATLLVAAPARPAGYAPGPFGFAEAADVRAILIEAGWSNSTSQRVAFAYRVGEGDDPVADAVAFFSRIGPAAAQLRDADPVDRDTLRAMLADRIAPFRQGDAVDFPATAWLWSARA